MVSVALSSSTNTALQRLNVGVNAYIPFAVEDDSNNTGAFAIKSLLDQMTYADIDQANAASGGAADYSKLNTDIRFASKPSDTVSKDTDLKVIVTAGNSMLWVLLPTRMARTTPSSAGRSLAARSTVLLTPKPASPCSTL